MIDDNSAFFFVIFLDCIIKAQGTLVSCGKDKKKKLLSRRKQSNYKTIDICLTKLTTSQDHPTSVYVSLHHSHMVTYGYNSCVIHVPWKSLSNCTKDMNYKNP